MAVFACRRGDFLSARIEKKERILSGRLRPFGTYHPARPFVHDLDEPGLEHGGEIVKVDLVRRLSCRDAVCHFQDCRVALAGRTRTRAHKEADSVSAKDPTSVLYLYSGAQTYLCQFGRKFRLHVRLFLKDKHAKQGDHLLGFVFRKRIIEHKLRQDEFIRRIDLARYPAFE